jgi:hypothetical protein
MLQPVLSEFWVPITLSTRGSGELQKRVGRDLSTAAHAQFTCIAVRIRGS